jgi:deoxyribodipyrimidine photo-lyase
MQASKRTKYNYALDYSIQLSNKYKKPLIVFFGLTDNFPDANLRHYHFMLQGLKDVKKYLDDLGLKFIIQKISPEKGITNLSKESCVVVVDRGYLRIQRFWRKYAAENMKCPLIQVEGDVIVPVEKASDKEEFAARTIRPKISNKKDDYLYPLKSINPAINSLNNKLETIDLKDIKKILSEINLDKSVKPVENFYGGQKYAEKFLKDFLKNKIDKYDELKNDPNKDYVSNLSPYIHFGQISTIKIALEVKNINSPGSEAFLEELIIRRELSINFIYYNKKYDSYDGLPEWTKKSIEEHITDKRKYSYSLEDFENAETHSDYWNAGQKQMIKTGKMHGYMRMYWGKKIIEWTKSPREAYKIALYLNNKYELDGRDPNGFTGVAWCFGKHDRPWKERTIFGKIRYMNANGLRRKFDIDKYAKEYN